MITRYDTSIEAELEEGLSAAARTVQRGRLVLLPTDTVYGVGADAFSAEAVARLLAAKGRGRQMPPPVLVSAKTTVEALAVDVPEWAHALVEELWPGPLTLVLRQQPSLQWDLGETRGTVAVRMPDHDVALALLARTGPMAVSSANRTGLPAATDADAAEQMLGHTARVLLDAGPTPGPVPSTIVDCTSRQGRLLRQGVVGLDTLNDIVSAYDTSIAAED